MTGSVRCAAVALFAAAVWATSTFAQDPRASTVQGVAREWLLLADRLDASATWQAAGPRFQKAITESRWAEGLARERHDVDPLDRRKPFHRA